MMGSLRIFVAGIAIVAGLLGGMRIAHAGGTETFVWPPIVLQPGPADGKDIWTTSAYSYAPSGGGPGGGLNNDYLRIGGWADTYLSLLEFNVSKLPKYAASAKLQLYSVPDAGSTGFYVDRITQPWDWRTSGTGADRERLWWADRPAATQYLPSPLPAPTRNAWNDIDLTSLYNGWKNGSIPNHGIQLRPTSTSNTFESFYSSDYTGNPSLRPKLVITPAMAPLPSGAPSRPAAPTPPAPTPGKKGLILITHGRTDNAEPGAGGSRT